MSDFTWVPHYVLTRKVKFVTVISEGEQGKERSRSKRTSGIYGFSLRFNNLTPAQANAMWDFYILKKGRNTSFTWTNPLDSVEYTVRFESDEMSQDYFRYSRYSLQLDFVKIN